MSRLAVILSVLILSISSVFAGDDVVFENTDVKYVDILNTGEIAVVKSIVIGEAWWTMADVMDDVEAECEIGTEVLQPSSPDYLLQKENACRGAKHYYHVMIVNI